MIKCYIFDQDGTLYSKENELTKVITSKTKEWIAKELHFNKDQIEELYAGLQKKWPNIFDGITSLGLSIEHYHENVFDSIDPTNYLAEDKRLVELFEKIEQPKYVVTIASRKYSLKLLEALNIENLLSGLLLMSDFLPKHSKSEAYNKVKEDLNLRSNDICVVGDNFHTDIMPALHDGFQTILIGPNHHRHNVRSVSSIYEII